MIKVEVRIYSILASTFLYVSCPEFDRKTRNQKVELLIHASLRR